MNGAWRMFRNERKNVYIYDEKNIRQILHVKAEMILNTSGSRNIGSGMFFRDKFIPVENPKNKNLKRFLKILNSTEKEEQYKDTEYTSAIKKMDGKADFVGILPLFVLIIT